jgi:hypothetical protein
MVDMPRAYSVVAIAHVYALVPLQATNATDLWQALSQALAS